MELKSWANPEYEFDPESLDALERHTRAEFTDLEDRIEYEARVQKVRASAIAQSSGRFSKTVQSIAARVRRPKTKTLDFHPDVIKDGKIGGILFKPKLPVLAPGNTTTPTNPPPAPIDNSFWWAKSWFYGDNSGFDADPKDDGYHVTGSLKQPDSNQIQRVFNLTALYAISPDRLPATDSGWYSSTPHVELFGGVDNYSAMWDVLQGNSLSKIDMTLRQTIYQNQLAGPGQSNRRILTQSEGTYNIMEMRNTGFARATPLPGFKLVPAAAFHESSLFRGDTLWAAVVVQFNIFLESSGSAVSSSPELLLRTFQWPLLGS
ncbi:MAG: hypothetical protein EON54_19220 [Alcaligenaceae bacterium]|nr:MAG: hypothetical protein EON54_19220 [Alcaligenaceae bacterium]